MKKVILSVVATVLVSSTAFGGALDTKVVGGGASWVFHADIEAMLASELGKMFLAAAEKKEGFAKGVEEMKKQFGCDPLKDIRGVTVYGPKFGARDAAVVVDATVAADKLIDILKEKESYKSEKYGKHAIHQWVEKKRGADETTYACFYDNKTVVIATGLARLKGALNVLDGDSDNLTKTKAIKLLPESADGEFFVMAADKIEFPDGKAPRAAMLRGITSAVMQCGESEGGLFMTASVFADSDEDATNMRQFVQGVLAFSMMMRQQEKFAALKDLGEKIEVSGKGKEVRVDASIPVKSLEKILSFMDERRKEFQARRRRAMQEKDKDSE